MRDIPSSFSGIPSPFGSRRFNPLSLFANGELGAFYGPLQAFTDTAGTTPATFGDQIARINDQSGNGLNMVQETVARRPLFGRAPIDRRNLLTWTGSLIGNGWFGSFGITATQVGNETRINNIDLGDGDEGYRRNLTVSPATVTFSLTLRGEGSDIGKTVRIRLKRVGGAFVDATTTVTLSAEPQRASVTMTMLPDNTGVGAIITAVGENQATNVFTSEPQIVIGSVRTPYQRVNSAVDMTEAGVPSFPFVRLDGLDDRLPTVIPAGGTFDIAVFGRLGSRIVRDEVIAPGGSITIGPTTFHTAPAGSIAAMGDIVGYTFIDRTITETELARVLSYFKARGAADFL